MFSMEVRDHTKDYYFCLSNIDRNRKNRASVEYARVGFCLCLMSHIKHVPVPTTAANIKPNCLFLLVFWRQKPQALLQFRLVLPKRQVNFLVYIKGNTCSCLVCLCSRTEEVSYYFYHNVTLKVFALCYLNTKTG